VNKNYPIKPKHLDTSEEPKGFDALLDYGQCAILWAFIQFWQVRGNWESFTHDEFLAFLDDSQSKVNKTVRCGVIWFVEPTLTSILRCSKKKAGDKEITVYEPSHFVISTYFLSNPSKKLFWP
jgi:hypothetical protein